MIGFSRRKGCKERSFMSHAACLAAGLCALLLSTAGPADAEDLVSSSYRHQSGTFSSSAAAGNGALTSSSEQPTYGSSDAMIGAVPTSEPVGSATSLASFLPGFWAIAVGGFPSIDLDGDLAQFFLDEDDDGDGIEDIHETGTGMFVSATNTGTSPTSPDSDGDGFDDGVEILAGSDPNDALSVPSNPAVPSLSLPLRLLLVLMLIVAVHAFSRRDTTASEVLKCQS
jgi:hypothetical protein